MEGSLSLDRFETIKSEIPQKILIEVFYQFIKDLEKIGDQALFPDLGLDMETLNANGFYKLICSFIGTMMKQENEKLWQLLYIVDIPEILLKNLPTLSEEKRIEQIAKLIFLREFQKVDLRKRFSQ